MIVGKSIGSLPIETLLPEKGTIPGKEKPVENCILIAGRQRYPGTKTKKGLRQKTDACVMANSNSGAV